MAEKDSASNPGTVTLAEVKDAPAEEIPKSTNSRPQSERKMFDLDHEQKQFRNELGWLGKPFGGKKEKPGNISGLVIVFCFLLIGYAYVFPPDEKLGMTFEQILAGLISVITLILGYLFGSNDRN